MSVFLEAVHNPATSKLNVRQMAVLSLLYDRPARSTNELALALGVARSPFCRLCDALEAKGLITRWPHPRDKRLKSVRMTDAGRAVMVAMRGRSP